MTFGPPFDVAPPPAAWLVGDRGGEGRIVCDDLTSPLGADVQDPADVLEVHELAGPCHRRRRYSPGWFAA
jgi:hypothetical protein